MDLAIRKAQTTK